VPKNNGIAGVLAKNAMENKSERFYLNMENRTIYLEEIFGTSDLKKQSSF
jgi:hypothetical protein